MPLPEPLAPLAIVSQVAPSVAVHAHPVPAVTDTEPLPPAAGMLCVGADAAYVQAVPACVIVTIRPAAVSVALRAVVEVFAAAVKATVPVPVPLAPLVMVNQVAESVAVHAHPVPAVTATVALPPAAAKLCVVAEVAYVQAAPACVTVTSLPAAVSVALRAVVDVFAVALTITVPFPDPLAPLAIVNHVDDSVAVHVHPVPTATATDIPPPAAAMLIVAGDTV